MSRTLFEKKKIYECLKNKLNINFVETYELKGWYYLEGKKLIRFKVPKGRGTISIGFQKEIENTSKLSKEDFELLIKCPMTGSDYEKKMKEFQGKY